MKPSLVWCWADIYTVTLIMCKDWKSRKPKPINITVGTEAWRVENLKGNTLLLTTPPPPGLEQVFKGMP